MIDEVDDCRLFKVGEAERDTPLRAPAGAAKTFRSYAQHQSFLLPPSLDDWLPAEHTARFVSEVVDNMSDVTTVHASYTNKTAALPN